MLTQEYIESKLILLPNQFKACLSVTVLLSFNLCLGTCTLLEQGAYSFIDFI